MAKDKSLNERQKKALNYVKENGSITNKIYQELNNVSKLTSTRDLTELVTMTILEIEGKGRNLQYVQSAHNRLNSVHVLSYSRLLLIFNFNTRQ